jgi:dCMP deaminase
MTGAKGVGQVDIVESENQDVAANASSMSAESAENDGFQTYGWAYRNDLSMDMNYMDLASLLSRNSRCSGGHMGCVLVRGDTASGGSNGPVEIISRAINTPLFAPDTSDIHAEVNAVALCARRGTPTAGATAYITMPPCRNCFMLLVASGVSRIVSRLACSTERIVTVAAEHGIALAVVPDDAETDARRAALVVATVAGDGGAERARIEAERVMRREARREANAERKRRRELASTAEVDTAMSSGDPNDQ